MSLQSLSRRVEKTRAKKKAAEKKKPVPRVDRSVEKAVKTSQIAVTGALTVGFKSLESQLKKLLKRPEASPVDPEVIKKAVAEGMATAKPQKITFPAKKPVSYQATIQRRGNQMTGALIEPIDGSEA